MSARLPSHKVHFPADYRSGRAAFIDVARKRGAQITSHPIDAEGPAGEALAIDTAYLGPKCPDSLLVIDSGTHGIEGFAGSAIQHQLLSTRLDTLELPSSMGLLLVHAINPYGFAWLRRANEHNVDLNRNFVAHPEGHVENDDYARLNEWINPTSLDPESEHQARIALREFSDRLGQRRLQVALAGGQYSHPRGVYYGGSEPEPENLILREIAREETRAASRIAWLNIHTGLGVYGHYTLISVQPAEHPAFRRGQEWFGRTLTESEYSGDAISPKLPGTVDHGVMEELEKRCDELTFFCQEFGTYDPTRVFWATRAENWLHHHGDRSTEQARAIRAELKEAFCPSDPSWRELILQGGARVIGQAVTGLSGRAEKAAAR